MFVFGLTIEDICFCILLLVYSYYNTIANDTHSIHRFIIINIIISMNIMQLYTQQNKITIYFILCMCAVCVCMKDDQILIQLI